MGRLKNYEEASITYFIGLNCQSVEDPKSKFTNIPCDNTKKVWDYRTLEEVIASASLLPGRLPKICIF